MSPTDPLVVAAEVREALRTGVGVVGLETSVIGQGLPSPRNAECVDRMAGAIRGVGAVPAWIGAVGGRLVVGLDDQALARFLERDATTKVARRDVPMALAAGALGATTVSATVWAAARAGITVSATGGIGGVHPGDRSDVSADLFELARTPGLLVCSGPKSIIDPVATADRLEELGVAIVGYGVDRLPFFLAREASVALEHRVDDPAAAASVAVAASGTRARSTVLLVNPIPADAAMDPVEVADATAAAERGADAAGVHGKVRTPFLLAALAEATDGRSLDANLALLEDNARVAGEVAAAVAVRA
jgi:pseudouridine-5'-phosphate glycosidase